MVKLAIEYKNKKPLPQIVTGFLLYELAGEEPGSLVAHQIKELAEETGTKAKQSTDRVPAALFKAINRNSIDFTKILGDYLGEDRDIRERPMYRGLYLKNNDTRQLAALAQFVRMPGTINDALTHTDTVNFVPGWVAATEWLTKLVGMEGRETELTLGFLAAYLAVDPLAVAELLTLADPDAVAKYYKTMQYNPERSSLAVGTSPQLIAALRNKLFDLIVAGADGQKPPFLQLADTDSPLTEVKGLLRDGLFSESTGLSIPRLIAVLDEYALLPGDLPVASFLNLSKADWKRILGFDHVKKALSVTNQDLEKFSSQAGEAMKLFLQRELSDIQNHLTDNSTSSLMAARLFLIGRILTDGRVGHPEALSDVYNKYLKLIAAVASGRFTAHPDLRLMAEFSLAASLPSLPKDQLKQYLMFCLEEICLANKDNTTLLLKLLYPLILRDPDDPFSLEEGANPRIRSAKAAEMVQRDFLAALDYRNLGGQPANIFEIFVKALSKADTVIPLLSAGQRNTIKDVGLDLPMIIGALWLDRQMMPPGASQPSQFLQKVVNMILEDVGNKLRDEAPISNTAALVAIQNRLPPSRKEALTTLLETLINSLISCYPHINKDDFLRLLRGEATIPTLSVQAPEIIYPAESTEALPDISDQAPPDANDYILPVVNDIEQLIEQVTDLHYGSAPTSTLNIAVGNDVSGTGAAAEAISNILSAALEFIKSSLGDGGKNKLSTAINDLEIAAAQRLAKLHENLDQIPLLKAQQAADMADAIKKYLLPKITQDQTKIAQAQARSMATLAKALETYSITVESFSQIETSLALSIAAVPQTTLKYLIERAMPDGDTQQALVQIAGLILEITGYQPDLKVEPDMVATLLPKTP